MPAILLSETRTTPSDEGYLESRSVKLFTSALLRHNGLHSKPTKLLRLDITAMYDNIDLVYIGNELASASDRRGHPMEAGDFYQIKWIPLDTIWMDSVTAGDGISFNAYVEF